MSQARNARKQFSGVVVSNKADKTIVVAIERTVKHPFYGKYIRKTSKIMGHDPENKCYQGDKVLLMETRPLSKKKRFRLVKILKSKHTS